MSANALFAQFTRAASICALMAFTGASADGQGLMGPSGTGGGGDNAPAPQPAGQTIQHIAVEGTQRIEPDTVISYISVRPGDIYNEQVADTALKTLFATGLF